MGREKKLLPRIAPAPANGAAAINSKSSPEEMAKWFRSRFRGRDDAYAMRWEAPNDGQAGQIITDWTSSS